MPKLFKLLLWPVMVLHNLRDLYYHLVFLAYDLAIVGTAFVMRRPALRQLVLKLHHGKAYARKSQAHRAAIDRDIQEWVHTVDQLYWVHKTGWGKRCLVKPPAASR